METMATSNDPPNGDVKATNGDAAATQKGLIHQRNGEESQESPAKRPKLTHDSSPPTEESLRPRQKGIAPIKPEFLIDISRPADSATHMDDDEAEAAGKSESAVTGGRGGNSAGRGGKKTKGGQNHARQFGSSRDAIQLCASRAQVNEFAAQTCRFGEECKFEHDVRRYLRDGKREDLETFGAKCPVWEVRGMCPAGWKCRFAGSHSKEVEREDGRMELVLIQKEVAESNCSDKADSAQDVADDQDEIGFGVVNRVSVGDKISLRKKQFPMPQSDKYLKWLSSNYEESQAPAKDDNAEAEPTANGVHDNRARYREPPLRPSEKRRIYYGPETPILAPLTTQGNLPFRRLCVSLGAQVTWSEMAMGTPLLMGEKQEWALMRAHESELSPPAYTPKSVVADYNHDKDIKFGAQIAANKPWLALKTTEVLTALCPHLRAIDLNCGCPIDLVYRQGAGSALLDTHTKLERILRGMNTVSGDIPITVKIRMGTKDHHPTAEKLCSKLILGTEEAQETGEGPAGVAAITLHGRSRQQRYSRSADWEYIASCASLVNKLRAQRAEITDTVREPDARDLSSSTSSEGLPYFIGNGDILSHVDYTSHFHPGSGIDACMIARGALVKPWVFEEIATNQYLDKSASERLGYIEQFVRNGLEYWGSDEIGVGQTRKFLLEWLSFSCRYVPLGLLEYLPPKFGDRPPAFRGRSELETLLSSANFRDWIKIRYVVLEFLLPKVRKFADIGVSSEMFLGPAHKDFQFQPKHKSNSYEIEAEG